MTARSTGEESRGEDVAFNQKKAKRIPVCDICSFADPLLLARTNVLLNLQFILISVDCRSIAHPTMIGITKLLSLDWKRKRHYEYMSDSVQ